MLRICLLLFTMIFSISSFAQVIAKAGNQSITKKEFETSYKQAVQNSVNFTRPPTKAEHLEDMIRFKLGLQEANRIKLKQNPLVKKALDLETYKGLLETQLGSKVDKIKVSEREMKSHYATHPQLRSSHVLIRFPVGATERQIAEAKSRAVKAYKDILSKKKKWNVYVRDYSEDETTKTTGGDIGYQTSESIYAPYYKTLKSLKMGEVSAPIKGLYGFHIIKKTGELSYERADKNMIKMTVFNKKRFDLLDQYFQNLKRKYKVSTNKDLL